KHRSHLLSFQSCFLVSTEAFFVISSEAEESLLGMRIKPDTPRPPTPGGCVCGMLRNRRQNREKTAMENIKRRTMFYPGNDRGYCQSAIRNLKSEILPMRV